MREGTLGKSREEGRVRRGPLFFVLAVAVGVALVLGPSADAQDASVARSRAKATFDPAPHRKAAAVEELCRMGNASARSAILDLADAGSDRTAMTAIAALCREDFSGAREKLDAIFRDTTRSDVVRCTAIIALLDLRARDGDSWGQVVSNVRRHTESGDMVRDAALAAATRHWGSAVSDE